MHTSKAFDAREPEAEEFIGPSFRFENMKGKDLAAYYQQIDFDITRRHMIITYRVVINSIDHHLHQVYLVRLDLDFRIGECSHCHLNLESSGQ